MSRSRNSCSFSVMMPPATSTFDTSRHLATFGSIGREGTSPRRGESRAENSGRDPDIEGLDRARPANRQNRVALRADPGPEALALVPHHDDGGARKLEGQRVAIGLAVGPEDRDAAAAEA